ncbi:MAG TPA: SPOR domain-containing protein [Edaphobacter sp.]|nr:SPOR domain-containing protein [Edaphobacter sp.]
MQLWSDYEGRTIAEAYPLKKLVRPEGRSAFFMTTNGTGTPAMVRLIEAHFDESEILERWRLVSEIQQENLVVMRKYGETMLDGTPLVYAVMEPTEISLAELLQNRTLSAEEAKQLAGALIGALTALHARGLVHEHVETANILAAGEMVKLRSDCVREANSPGDGKADMATRKAADAHAVAMVLLEALTGRRSLQGSATLLPSPFDGIIRNGLSGKWGLSEMSAALGPVSPKQVAAATAAPRPAGLKEPLKDPVLEKGNVTSPAPPAPGETKPSATPTLFDKVESSVTAQSSKQTSVPSTSAGRESPARPHIPAQAPDVRHRIVKPVEEDPRRTRLWIAAAAAVLVLIFVAWRMTRNDPAAGASARPAATTTSSRVPATASAPDAVPEATTAAPSRPTAAIPLTGRTQWRVVAYTYNREAQAQQKVDDLKKQQSSLNPEVFSPNGRSPYLVTVGGAMSREDAESFKRKARGSGLPRDLYAQNFTH